MKRLTQSGSHVIAIAVLVLSLSVVGYAGYAVEQAHKSPAEQSATVTTTQAQTATVPAKISSAADLQQASTVLDDSSSQLNSSLNDNGLNADLNSML